MGIHVYNEIGNLKRVLLHRPGDEFLNLTPNTLERLLFDDIPYLKTAKMEHDAFAEALRNEGVEVVYLTDLMKETLDSSSKLREKFLKQFIRDPCWKVRYVVSQLIDKCCDVLECKEFDNEIQGIMIELWVILILHVISFDLQIFLSQISITF